MEPNKESILNELAFALNNGDGEERVNAAKQLGQMEHRSLVILRLLESIAAQDPNEAVREAALEALISENNRKLQNSSRFLTPKQRQLMSAEIEKWARDRLITKHQARVIEQRYTAYVPKPVVKPTPKPRPMPQARPKPARKPPRSLRETLFSEASIKIALYLGAFMVVAAAFILAAVVEEARMPILFIATLGFIGGAVGIYRRLPQASFVLFAVFTLLLPIDARVLADSFSLSGNDSTVFWMGVWIVIGTVWGVGTWLYRSKLYSLLALGAGNLVAYQLGQLIDYSLFLHFMLLGIPALAGLGGVYILRRWQGKTLATPLFLAVQLQQATLIGISLLAILSNTIFDNVINGEWMLIAMAWLLGALFYIASNFYRPLFLFPWMATAALIPVPWFLLGAASTSLHTGLTVTWLWAAVMAIGGEALRAFKREEARPYGMPFMLAALPLFGIAILGGFIDGANTLSFWYLAGFSLVYLGLTIYKPRGLVFLTSLMAAIFAYLTAFEIPIFADASLYYGYKMLIPTLVFLSLDLGARRLFQAKSAWHLPPRLLGLAVGSLNILWILPATSYAAQNAVIFTILGVYAIGYAILDRKPWIGFAGTTSFAAALAYGLFHFEPASWVISFLGLASLFFLSGFIFSLAGKFKKWNRVLRISGLVLGGLIAFGSLFQPDLSHLALAYATLGTFLALHTAIRWDPIFAYSATISYAISLAAILFHLKERNGVVPFLILAGAYFLTGFILTKAKKAQGWAEVLRVSGLVLGGLTAIFSPTQGDPAYTALAFGVYAGFLALHTAIKWDSNFAYGAAVSLTIALPFTLLYLEYENWVLPALGLAGVYFLGGLALSLTGNGRKWAEVLRYSGLMLGGLTAFGSPSLEELSSSAIAFSAVAGFLALNTLIEWRPAFAFGATTSLTLALPFALAHYDVKPNEWALPFLGLVCVYYLAGFSLSLWRKNNRWAGILRRSGLALGGLVAIGSVFQSHYDQAALAFIVFSLYLALETHLNWEDLLAYGATFSLTIALPMALAHYDQETWLAPALALSSAYFVAGFGLAYWRKENKWGPVLLISGLLVGTLTAFTAHIQGGQAAVVTVAAVATFYAAEAFRQRNVWLGFPANLLYLWAYYMVLIDSQVTEPQFFTVAAAALGFVQHYFLVRGQYRRPAFFTGLVSQLILLGTTYSQLLSQDEISLFFILFFQSLAVLTYGLVVRSRSFVITPIVFIILGVVNVTFGLLSSMNTAFVIGCTGISILIFGILGLVMRERLLEATEMIGERMSGWND